MARLALTFFGEFGAVVDSVPVSGFDTDKTRALLAYLALESARPHSREALAALLWPELPEDSARRNLRNSLFRLRQALGEAEEGPGFLLVNSKTVQLDPAADVALDVAAFNDLLAACRAHRHRHIEHCATCHGRLSAAAALYGGDLLAGLHLAGCVTFEEWLVLARERLHRAALAVLGRLAAYHESRADGAAALEYTFRQLELEPWREESHRQAMRLLAASGQRSAALAQYAACRRALAAELNAEPAAETTALHEQIRAGVQPPTAAAAPGYLPQQLTPFVGREVELQRIAERLDSPDYRLITLTGPGGVGKTRLAWQAAEAARGSFADGVFWIALAPLAAPDMLPASIAQAVGLRLDGADNPAAQLAHLLHDKDMLLVLDNFEQLLGDSAAAEALLAILQRAPRISMLVTSRERLDLQAEVAFDLAGLPLPRLHIDSRSSNRDFTIPGELIASGAVQLFVERAQQAQPLFSLTPGTAGAVVEICRLVAGLPLGIVLAAAWVRRMPPAQIAAAIRANLDFLANTSRDMAPQHRSLRAVFDHSWNLLAPAEQAVFRRLAVFRGGWTAEAAAHVAGASPDALLSLADKSLLRQDIESRFEVHEVLRQYAAEKLRELPEEEAITREDHADYFLQLAEAAEAGLRGDAQEQWLAQLEHEHDNLRAAIAWAQEQAQTEPALRLAAALSRFWYIRGYHGEGRASLTAALALPTGDADLTAHRAKALRAVGDLARAQGDYNSAWQFCEDSLNLYRELGDKREIAIALNRLAIVAWNQPDLALARQLFAASLAISRELGDKQQIAVMTGNMGMVAYLEGDYAAARALYEESLVLLKELGDKFNLAIRFNNLGNVALMQGDYPLAGALHREGLARRQELQDKWGIAVSLIGLGGVAVCSGDAATGVRLLSAARLLLDDLGVSLEPDDRIPYEHGITAAHTALDDAAFAAAWAAGRAMGLADAIAVALAINPG